MKKKYIIIVSIILAIIIFLTFLFFYSLSECHKVGGIKDGASISRANCEIAEPYDIYRIIIEGLNSSK